MSRTAKRSESIYLWINTETKTVIERAAQLRNITLSAYLIDSALQKAKEDYRDTETFFVHEKDRELFFTTLSSPPTPNVALHKLFHTKTEQKNEP